MSKPPSRWKSLRYRLEVWGLRLGIWIVPRLPRKWMLKVARVISRLGYWIDTRGRRIAAANLVSVFPEKSLQERRRIAKDSYHYLGISVFDLFWARGNLTPESAKALVRYTFEDPDQEVWMGHGPSIWVTLHYGSFEWLSIQWALTHETKPLIVAEDFKNPPLTQIFRELREYSGVKVIRQERAMLRLLRHLKRGGQTAFLSDLRVKPSKAATIIQCFGFKTCVTRLHAFLAQETGAPILPVICLPEPAGSYVFHFLQAYRPLPGESAQAITQHCWDVFEPFIRKAPGPWLWMYKHWRHLPDEPAAADRYPAYADHSQAFIDFDKQAFPEGVTTLESRCEDRPRRLPSTASPVRDRKQSRA